MKPLRTYFDSSVLGGYYDLLFEKETKSLILNMRNGTVIPVLSEMVTAEISRAPMMVQRLLDDIIRSGAEVLSITEEAVELQEAYLKSGVLSRRWEDDAMHVAVSTLARVDVIASWNFKHLVNPRRLREFNGINLSMGYGLISILSPSDIVRSIEEQP